ncbi:hypothetical protein K402DRAFT_91288 [Aulographum hederae CBS 113979]|uniref:Uncharacterized protein n=1 Tax=Aulographum hederae CBS 113979 TaxID=1176131 RepID=A0A6G1GYX2_9PEZI|nr:hypothetical protein K402DRAFT_91288 [Aulographum hederae CBS 113979]
MNRCSCACAWVLSTVGGFTRLQTDSAYLPRALACAADALRFGCDLEGCLQGSRMRRRIKRRRCACLVRMAGPSSVVGPSKVLKVLWHLGRISSHVHS